jgi:hypothetical protein
LAQITQPLEIQIDQIRRQYLSEFDEDYVDFDSLVIDDERIIALDGINTALSLAYIASLPDETA